MKLPAPPRTALILALLAAVPAHAQMIEVSLAKSSADARSVMQDSPDQTSFAADQALSGLHQLPAVSKAHADLSEINPVFISQDASTLSARRASARKIEQVLDLSLLKQASAYRTASTVKMKVSDQQGYGINAGLREISAAYQTPTSDADCDSVSLSVRHRVEIDPSEVLEIVSSEISANASCACEIVKSAIIASGADVALVGDITEVAITSAPESMRMISQCAIAAMPEALAEVQKVLAKLDPNRGDSSYSSKDSKSGKDAIASAVSPPEPWNPLILPPPLTTLIPLVPNTPIPPDPMVVTNPNP